MDFIKELAIAFRSYGDAFKFIDKHRLYHYIFAFSLLNIIIAGLVGWFALVTSDELMNVLIIKLNLSKGYETLGTVLQKIIEFIIRGSIVFLYLKLFRYSILILYSPFLAFISEKVQCLSTGIKRCYSFKRYLKDVVRGIRVAIKNFVLELVITFAVILLAILVTWLVPLLPFMLVLIESYFFGFAMADYRNEFLNKNLKESQRIINNHAGLVLGNGLFFNICLLIPLLGVLFAPSLALLSAGLSLNQVEEEHYYGDTISQPI